MRDKCATTGLPPAHHDPCLFAQLWFWLRSSFRYVVKMVPWGSRVALDSAWKAPPRYGQWLIFFSLVSSKWLELAGVTVTVGNAHSLWHICLSRVVTYGLSYVTGRGTETRTWVYSSLFILLLHFLLYPLSTSELSLTQSNNWWINYVCVLYYGE